jgi:NADPH-dependent 2,4-dienoyl-CoA reductase/sulfur reductase-like enzyme
MRRLGVKPALIACTSRLSDSVRAVRRLSPWGLLPIAKGLGWLAHLRLANVKLVSGISRLEATGNTKVEAVSFSVGTRRFTYPCDLLVVHDGIVPSIDLAHGAGVALEWDSTNSSWRPKSSVDGATAAVRPGAIAQPCKVRVSGDARQIGGAEAAIAHGRLAAAAILAELNKGMLGAIKRAELAMAKAAAARPFLDAAFPAGLSADLPSDDTIVCRCEELTAGFLRVKIRAGARDMDQLRGETRCGMGPCQGRSCMITVARLIAEVSALPVPLRTFRARPPVRPLPLGSLANLTGLDLEASKVMTLEDKPACAIGEVDRADEQ